LPSRLFPSPRQKTKSGFGNGFYLESNYHSDYQENKMDYYGGYSSELENFPSSIHLYYHLPPEEFADLLRDIRSGQILSSVTINFDDKYKGNKGALTFGWEPDGSGKKWNNDRSTGEFRIGIDSVRLFYERSSLSEIAKQTQELTGRLQAIERNVTQYGRLWTIFVFVITFLVFLIARGIK
jgi:hypothetical protein